MNEQSKDQSIQNIPTTGRIGRFAKIVAAQLSQDAFADIMRDSHQYKTMKPVEKAAWWQGAVERLEEAAGQAGAVDVMTACGNKCCGRGQRKTARRRMVESASIEAFLERLSKHDVKDGDLTYTMLDENTIIAEYNKCFCGQVSRFEQLFPTDTYCQCSVAFNKAFFEAALEKPVEVTLTQSTLNGAQSCKFMVNIGNRT